MKVAGVDKPDPSSPLGTKGIGEPLLGVDEQVLEDPLTRSVMGDQLDEVVALGGGVLGRRVDEPRLAVAADGDRVGVAVDVAAGRGASLGA